MMCAYTEDPTRKLPISIEFAFLIIRLELFYQSLCFGQWQQVDLASCCSCGRNREFEGGADMSDARCRALLFCWMPLV